MGRPVYCVLCAFSFPSVAGHLPTVCPSCTHRTTWTTLAPDHASDQATTPYALTHNDRRFLRSLRIAADELDVRRED